MTQTVCLALNAITVNNGGRSDIHLLLEATASSSINAVYVLLKETFFANIYFCVVLKKCCLVIKKYVQLNFRLLGAISCLHS